MILEHNTLQLYGQPLFTQVTFRTPMQDAVPIPSEACFAYIVEGDRHYLYEEENLRAEPGKIILSLCGYTVSRMLAKEPITPGEGLVSTIIVHFNREVLQKVYEHTKPPHWKELEKPVVKYLVHDAASELIRQYFTGLAPFFSHPEVVSEDLLILKLQEIILFLLKTEASEQITQIMRSLFSERTFTFKEIVEAHICEPVTIEQLAMLTHHSLTSFKREFKRIYDTTPGAYIIEKRTEKVAELLLYSDDSISGIGYQCGFTSPAHLSRAFKSKYGMTPSAFRAEAMLSSTRQPG